MSRVIFLILTFTLTVLISSGCQTIINDAVELPYQESIVVQALIEAGKPITSIHIAKNVPALDSITPQIVFIADAVVTVRVDGRAYNAVLKPDSAYLAGASTPQPYRSLYAVPNLIVQSGKTYQLTVQWRGKTTTAQTLVPATPVLTSSVTYRVVTDTTTRRGSNQFERSIELETMIAAQPHEVYAMYSYGTDIVLRVTANAAGALSSYLDTTLVFSNIPGASGANRNDVIDRVGDATTAAALQLHRKIRIDGYGSGFTTPPPFTIKPSTAVYAIVQAFDAPYYDYFITIDRNRNQNPLATGGLNPLWNVSGDGIGIFIGVATKEILIHP